MANRWWVYQRERFPIFAHSPIILAFSLSAVSYSALLRGASTLPGWKPCFVAFANSFLTFLQLRLADEFKDFDEDSRFRPYRPVPSGLIKLRELAWIWVGCIFLQLLLALWLSPRLIPLLVVTWIYLGLMSREFLMHSWLKARPITYMLSHMAIMPLVDLYTTACDWVPLGYRRPPRGLLWFLLVSYCNGVVLEIGRKIRTPGDEETGVETYSFLWGRYRAVLVWLSVMTLTAVFAVEAARGIAFGFPATFLLGSLVLISSVLGVRFLAAVVPGRGKSLEAVGGVWSLILYLTLGVIPIAIRWWGRP
ncbi:MAG TPA: UbiA family prenyltransferase [Acidobacteriaceae bacterium]|nr:UbiA family prenyltransferase [Acidobacteriaceae bacterium]